MPSGSPSTGSVFISHSSVDKAFVRKLDQALQARGFLTWLDERELRAGDPLAGAISEAVAGAGALIVVVSQASMKSHWLKYELNLATDRLIAGSLRVIPAITEGVELPTEMRGRVYADFRSSFSTGLVAVVRALEAEERVGRRAESVHGFEWKAAVNDALRSPLRGFSWVGHAHESPLSGATTLSLLLESDSKSRLVVHSRRPRQPRGVEIRCELVADQTFRPFGTEEISEWETLLLRSGVRLGLLTRSV